MNWKKLLLVASLSALMLLSLSTWLGCGDDDDDDDDDDATECGGNGQLVDGVCRCNIGYKGTNTDNAEDYENPDNCVSLEDGDVPDVAARRFMTCHGVFELTPETEEDICTEDPRNPLRILMQSLDKSVQYSTTVISFSTHDDKDSFLAKNCHYQYAGSQVDPKYFNMGYLSSIWDLFELLDGESSQCQDFAKVIVRAPHGDSHHMHLRYGDSSTDFESLLDMSNDTEDGYDPWWSHYIDSSGETPTSQEFSYTNVNGTFEMDAVVELTTGDIRNPSKMTLTTQLQTDPATALPDDETISQFVFQTHDDVSTIWADCNYRYRGAIGDPFYFPQYKHSIWDLFEQTSANSGACEEFAYALFRSPHADPVHVHMRYGNSSSTIESLLSMSLDEEEGYDPWWSVYCEEGVSGCD